MAIPVIDFSKLDSNERPETMARIANGCEEWGFFQVLTQLHFISVCIVIFFSYRFFLRIEESDGIVGFWCSW